MFTPQHKGAGGDTGLRRELQAASSVHYENAVHSYIHKLPQHLSFKNKLLYTKDATSVLLSVFSCEFVCLL